MSTMEATTDVTGSEQTPVPATAGASLWRRMAPWVALAGGLVFGIVLQTQLYSGQVRLVSAVLMYVARRCSCTTCTGRSGWRCRPPR